MKRNSIPNLAHRLLDFGVLYQESMFECVLDGESRERLIEKLDKIELAGTDRVRIYRLCQTCMGTVKIYGPGELTRDPEFYLV